MTVAGEIDIATATRLRERLREPTAGGRPLAADLDQVRFIDSAAWPRWPGRPGGPPRTAAARTLDEALDAVMAAPGHAPLAGCPDSPDRRPRSPGGEDRVLSAE